MFIIITFLTEAFVNQKKILGITESVMYPVKYYSNTIPIISGITSAVGFDTSIAENGR